MLGQIIINSLITGSSYAMSAIGFTLIYGVMNFFNMAHGVPYVIGAYLAYCFRILLGMNIIISIILSISITIIILILTDYLFYRPLRLNKAPTWALVVCSIGVSMIMYAIVAVIFGSGVLSLRKGLIITTHTFYDRASITSIQIIILFSCIIIPALLTLILKKTRMGKAMRAVSNDVDMAEIIGINVNMIWLFTFAIGSGIVAYSGCMLSLETDLVPTMGAIILVRTIVSSVIGKVGNIWGAVFGGLILGFAENFGVFFIGAGWKNAIALGLLVIYFSIQSILKRVESEKREE